MSRLVFAATALLAFALPTAADAAFTPSQFVVFGDSFLDAGAVNHATDGLFAPASQGFWQGRFSDGPNWIDYLGYANFGVATKAFNRGADVLPPPFTLGATNFAVGGARASGDDVQPIGTIPGLPTQMALYQGYLASTGQTVDSNALYVLNFGNNDVTLIESIQDDPELTPVEKSAQIAAVQNAYVQNMTVMALGLAANGAKHILIAGVPNPLEAHGQFLQMLLNNSLAAAQPNFDLLGSNLYQFDYFDFFNDLFADPTQFGLPADLDFATPCLAAEVPGPNVDCTGYLSFDGIHVTTDVQRAIAIRVAEQIGIASVPEPAAWGLMLAGFGAIGVALRRSRRVQLAT